jgi:inner membrane protein
LASPAAHSLAGAIIFLAARRKGNGSHRELLWIVLAANLADLDFIPGLLVGEPSLYHRAFSHSIPAALLFAVVVYAVCWRGRHPQPVRMTVLMFAAYASQLTLDWLSFDPGPVVGIPLFLPFSQEHFMADPTLFLNIERTGLLSGPVILHNIKAVLLELLILGPPAALLWLWQKRASRR